jgi:hypothetical protein
MTSLRLTINDPVYETRQALYFTVIRVALSLDVLNPSAEIH